MIFFRENFVAVLILYLSGYYYATQIAQCSLAHYCKFREAKDTLFIEDGDTKINLDEDTKINLEDFQGRIFDLQLGSYVIGFYKNFEIAIISNNSIFSLDLKNSEFCRWLSCF